MISTYFFLRAPKSVAKFFFFFWPGSYWVTFHHHSIYTCSVNKKKFLMPSFLCTGYIEEEKNLKMVTISKEYWYVSTLAKDMILKSILIYEAKGIACILDLCQNCYEISFRFWHGHFFHEHSQITWPNLCQYRRDAYSCRRQCSEHWNRRGFIIFFRECCNSK